MKSDKVFVVHGRNEKIRKSMFAFLRSIGLTPLEWPQIVHSLGQTNPFIGDVLDHGFSISKAMVILMTPDDEAKLKNELVKESDPIFESELTPQPRQNVLIEAGMALGKFPNQTVIVQFGTLRQISDLLGRHVIRLNNSSEQRHELVQRLKTCGCNVDTSGKDWFTEGDFELERTFQISEPNLVKNSSTESIDKNEYSGPSGGIQSLIDNQFFNQPRTLKEILDELVKNNYHYPNTTISSVLNNVFVKNRKSLIRINSGKVFSYAIRK